jgi:hypothetical protein
VVYYSDIGAARSDSNVVPALLSSPVFGRNVVPLLSPGQQLRDYVAADGHDFTTTPGQRCG